MVDCEREPELHEIFGSSKTPKAMFFTNGVYYIYPDFDEKVNVAEVQDFLTKDYVDLTAIFLPHVILKKRLLQLIKEEGIKIESPKKN